MYIENQLDSVLNINISEITDLNMEEEFYITNKTIQIEPNKIDEISVEPNSMIYLFSDKSPGVYRRDKVGTDYIENYCNLLDCKISICELNQMDTGFNPDIIIYTSVTIPKCIMTGFNVVNYFAIFIVLLICAIVLATYLWASNRI